MLLFTKIICSKAGSSRQASTKLMTHPAGAVATVVYKGAFLNLRSYRCRPCTTAGHFGEAGCIRFTIGAVLLLLFLYKQSLFIQAKPFGVAACNG